MATATEPDRVVVLVARTGDVNRPVREADTPSSDHELTSALDAIAAELTGSGDVDRLLRRISELATEAIDGCDHAGVTVAIGKEISTPPLADEVASLMDDLQVEHGEGPCLDAVRTNASLTVVPDLQAERRWPSFAKVAWERTSIRSILSERLEVSDQVLGALNLYSRRPDAFTDADRSTAWVFSSYAALALYAASTQQDLTRALQTRDVIGQAKGILMVRLGVDDDAAFAALRQGSMNLNIRLRDVARGIVEHAGDNPGEGDGAAGNGGDDATGGNVERTGGRDGSGGRDDVRSGGRARSGDGARSSDGPGGSDGHDLDTPSADV